MKIFYSNLVNNRTILCRLLLFAGWILGISLGCLTACFIPVNDSLMHMLMDSHMSIVGGFAVCCLPLFITAIVVWFSKTIFLIPLAFIKAYLFALTAGLFSRIFNDAGWLIRLLFVFSGTVLSFFFLRLWYCCLKDKVDKEREFLITTICCVVVFFVDYFIVAPFAAILF